jgi:S-methylmethionine-dependent homocysteine/selenocysteine methylase
MKLNTILESGSRIITDGGLETTLIFHKGIELRSFAAFELMNSQEGRETLKSYYLDYLKIARDRNLPFLLETPTWRANPDWGKKLGYSEQELFEVNKFSVQYFQEILDSELDLISGCIGPRGDGYQIGNRMKIDDAWAYHATQILAFKEAGADFVSAFTINYPEEAIGITLAAKEQNIPVVISYTVETDGKLPSGMTLADAIRENDLVTGEYPTYYMVNCAHPMHFSKMLETSESWIWRIKGVRANSSLKSHAELDESDSLDVGDKTLLASCYSYLDRLLPELRVIGGCCGTDHSHIERVMAELT